MLEACKCVFVERLNGVVAGLSPDTQMCRYTEEFLSSPLRIARQMKFVGKSVKIRAGWSGAQTFKGEGRFEKKSLA